MAYQTIDPSTGTLVETFENFTDNKLNKALRLANKAFHTWKKSEFHYRSELFRQLASLIEKEKHHHASLITLEMGKPITQSLAEVEKCAWVCRYYADNFPSFLEPKQIDSSALKSIVRFEPLGIIYAIMPWNFPYWQVFRFLAPTLIAGNVGLLKHASNVPMCALAIEKLLLDAGFPSGVFQNLFINYYQSENLIRNPDIKGITLTGSNIAGAKVASMAGQHIKKMVMELGGSDPFIVFEDADVEKAVDTGILSRYLNAGQSCIAAKRFIIHENIFEKFTALFTQRVNEMVMGDPRLPETFIGPMARRELVDEIDRQVIQSINKGAKIITGTSPCDRQDCFCSPVVLTDVPLDSPAACEELFGPVAPFFSFKTTDQAIWLANNTQFGLGAAVWSSDAKKAAMVSHEIFAGTLVINGMVKSEPALPFGGVKDSGYGRELSEFGIREFVNIKTVNIF